MSLEEDFIRLEAKVRSKDVVRFIRFTEEYEKAAKELRMPTVFDDLDGSNRMRRIRKLYREGYGLKSPIYYDEDIKLFFDMAAELQRDQNED